MPTVKAFNLYTGSEEKVKLTLLQWLKLKLFGITSVGKRRYPRWRGHLPFYIYKCPNCGGMHLDYPHGYRGVLLCSQEVAGA